jgi:hypothetical protein
MYNQVKPGGRILVQDYYVPVIDSYPSPETDAEIKKVFFGVYEKAGKERAWGQTAWIFHGGGNGCS